MFTGFFVCRQSARILMLLFVLIMMPVIAKSGSIEQPKPLQTVYDLPFKQKHEPVAAASYAVMASIIEVEETSKQKQTYPTMRVTATGYTAGVESTGKKPGHPDYGLTKSGVKVKRAEVSTIAADPKVLPIGTLIYVPGYGYGVVADTGAAIKGKRIDLYFETVTDVYREWGKKTVDIQVLKLGKGKLTQSELNELTRSVQAYKEIR